MTAGKCIERVQPGAPLFNSNLLWLVINKPTGLVPTESTPLSAISLIPLVEARMTLPLVTHPTCLDL